jgi:hypothetical protein
MNCDKIISEFSAKYPQVASKFAELNSDYPLELKLKIAISVSVLMSKLDRGDYKKYQKTPTKLPDNVIDMFGRTYIQNYSRVADQVFQAMGNYNTFPKIVMLQPDNFIEKLISQFAC